ncbi:MAG: thiamine pyrophosphate-dependent enzyme [Candidatus Pacearchaeota archaeon]
MIQTNQKITWCPGCGNFAILSAAKEAFLELIKEGVKKENIVLASGIGCHGKIVDYINLNSIYCLHGRGIPIMTGIKLANPHLLPIGFFGDGDALNEGIEHLIHAAKRNSDITVLIHNNGVFALTTGQVTATSELWQKNHSTPFGNPEEPLNVVALMLESNATFVARGYTRKHNHLKNLIKEAIKHKGFSFIEILQPCITYNNTFSEYNSKIYEMKEIPLNALEVAKERARIPIGIFRKISKPTYEEIVMNLVKKN